MSIIDGFEEWSGDDVIQSTSTNSNSDNSIATISTSDQNAAKCIALNKRFDNPSAQRIIAELMNQNKIPWTAPDDNPYRIQFTMNTQKIGKVLVELKFHYQLYPYYPPSLLIISPFLSNISGKIPMLKMVQLQYWNPTRTIGYILGVVQQILDVHATDIVVTKHHQAVENFQNALLYFASFSNSVITDDLDPTVYAAVAVAHNHNNSSSSSSSSTKSATSHLGGVGYGVNKSASWNIEQWEAAKEEKMRQRDVAIKQLSELATESYAVDKQATCSIVAMCKTPQALLEMLREASILEMAESISNWCIIIGLITTMATNDPPIGDAALSLYKVVITHYSTIGMISEPVLAKAIRELMKAVKSQLSDTQIKQAITGNTGDPYLSAMHDLQFGDHEIIAKRDSFYLARGTLIKNYDNPKRIMAEKAMLFNNLPVNRSAAILCRHDDSNSGYYKFALLGADDTPYSGGFFIFDVSLPASYPYPTKGESPIRVILITTGNNTVRFNPNLYSDGKVCLTLLGTFPGSPSECWRPKTSSVLQLMLSLHATVMNSMPYYNEPGYVETAHGNVLAVNYNYVIRLATMRWAMLDHIKNPPPAFADAIHVHFKERRDEIIAQCKKWVGEAPEAMKKEYDAVYYDLKSILRKL